MKRKTRWLIWLLLSIDPTVGREQKKIIMEKLDTPPNREVVSSNAARHMLGCTQATLRNYVKRGWIRQTSVARGNAWYVLDDSNRLKQYGPPTKK